MPEEKVAINIEKFGNTTAAMIPLALSDAVDAGRLERGDTLLMVSVGAGFTVGALLLKWGLKTDAATRTGVRNSSASEL